MMRISDTSMELFFELCRSEIQQTNKHRIFRFILTTFNIYCNGSDDMNNDFKFYSSTFKDAI